jgi:outer membrane murein-binding lipoprotein Lpp
MIVRVCKAVLTAEEMTMASVEELNAAVAELDASVDAAVAAIGSASASGIKPEELDAAVAGIQNNIKKLNDAVHAAGM